MNTLMGERIAAIPAALQGLFQAIFQENLVLRLCFTFLSGVLWTAGSLAAGEDESYSERLVYKDRTLINRAVELTVDMTKEAFVLLVWDDSGSMHGHLEKGVEASKTFLTNLQAHYQRLSVQAVTTSSGDRIEDASGLPELVKAGDLVQSFGNSTFLADVERNLMSVGTRGYGTERHLSAVEAAIFNLNSGSGPAVSPKSDLIIIFVSDEEDKSPGAISRYTNLVHHKFPSTGTRYVFAVTVLDEDEGSKLSSGQNQCIWKLESTFRLQEFVGNFRGGILSLCADLASEIPNLLKRSLAPRLPYIELPTSFAKFDDGGSLWSYPSMVGEVRILGLKNGYYAQIGLFSVRDMESRAGAGGKVWLMGDGSVRSLRFSKAFYQEILKEYSKVRIEYQVEVSK